MLAAAFGLASLGLPARARAQACCASSTALSPGRLGPREDALAGVQLRIMGLYGSFNSHAGFVAAPKGATEIDLEQDLLATVRVLGRGQVSMIAPVVETLRRVPGASEAGGGLGDLQLAARWDFTLAGAHVILPGLAAVASLTLPTGVAPEAAVRPLATDATGTGSFQGVLGLAAEQTFGHVLVNLTGAVTLRSARDVAGMHTQQGPAVATSAAAGWMFDAGPVLALTAVYTAQLEARSDGASVPDTARRFLRLGVSGGVPFDMEWRLQGGVFSDLPALGKNEPAGVGGAATLIRVW